MIKLDLLDRKILYELDLNCRQSAAQIGRKVRRSRAVINYRIKSLKDAGIIKKFIVSVNLGKLGFSTYKLYFKLMDSDGEKKKAFITYAISRFQVIHCIKTEGAFDFSIVFAAKKILELDNFICELKTRFADVIRDYRISIIVKTHVFGRGKILLPNVKHTYRKEIFSEEDAVQSLDIKDSLILASVSRNASKSILEIAKETKLSVDVVKYRMKKLASDKIIFSFRLLFDPAKLGLYHYVFLINTQNATKQDESRLITWCEAHAKIMYLTKRVGFWEYELHVALQDIEDFSKFSSELESEFSKILNSHETLLYRDVLKLTYFPFNSLSV